MCLWRADNASDCLRAEVIKIHRLHQTRSAAHIEYGSALTQEKSVRNYVTHHVFLGLRSRVNCENISHTLNTSQDLLS